MREFFKPWRRKIGCVTLVMALFVTGLQHRSDGHFDGLYLDGKQTVYSVVSADNRVRFATTTSQIPQRMFIHWAIGLKLADIYRDPYARADVKWRRDWMGGTCGVFQTLTPAPSRVGMLAVPHSFFIYPFTMLSAYLLLVKPRPFLRQRRFIPKPRVASPASAPWERVPESMVPRRGFHQNFDVGRILQFQRNDVIPLG